MSKYDALAEIKKATAEYTKVLERVVQALEKEQQGAQDTAVKVEAKVSAPKKKESISSRKVMREVMLLQNTMTR